MSATAPIQHDSPVSLEVPALIGAAITLFLLCFAGRYGYMPDELYFLACAEHPTWGYVDLPPLLPWITWLVSHTLGTSLFAIRLYSAIAAGATVLLAARLAAELGGHRRAVITTAILVSICPIALAFGHILSTNALDMPLWTAAAFILVRIEKTGNSRLWLAFGAIAGITLMGKYSLAFYLAALLVGTLLTPWRKWFLDRCFWAGVAIALAITLPNILWQAHRQFPFLQLQYNINAHHRNVVLSPLQFIAAQALLVNFLSFAFVITGVVFLFTPAVRRLRALGWTFLAYMVLMYAFHAKDYLITPVYPMMLAAGAVASERWFRSAWGRRAVTAYVGAACVQSIVFLPSVVPVLSIEQFDRYYQAMPLHRVEAEHNTHSAIPDYYSDTFGWQERAQAVALYYNSLPQEEKNKTAIYAGFYGQAGAIDHFGPALGLPKAICSHHSYWYFGTRGYTGESVIVLDGDPEYLRRHCASVTLVADPRDPWSPRHNPIYHCRKLDYDVTKKWESLRHFD